MRSLLLFATLGVSAGIALGASLGCLACDDGVCSSTLWIYFDEPDGGALANGTYVIDIVVDGEPDTATCTIADEGHTLDCDGLQYTLYTPLYGPDKPHTVLELYFEEDPPDDVEVRITHDGAVILDETITPDYELAEPKCDADCMHATNRFELQR